MFVRRLVPIALVCASLVAPAGADPVRYRLPPPAIEAALNAPPIPLVATGSRRSVLVLETPLRYPPVADLARPMLRLAGLRIDPATNGIHHAPAFTALAIERIADGRVVHVALPPGARVTAVHLSPDESRFAFTNATANGTELWTGTTASGRASRVAALAVNDVFRDAVVVDARQPAPRRARRRPHGPAAG